MADFPDTLVAVDLADRASTVSTLERFTSQYRFSGLINNFGLIRPQGIGDIDLDDMDAVLDLNSRPAVQAARSILPHMRTRLGTYRHIASLTVRGPPGVPPVPALNLH